MSKIRLAQLGLLAAMAVFWIAVPAASGRLAGRWYCLAVAAGRGSWNTDTCLFSGSPYNRTWGYAYDSNQIFACEKGGFQYENAFCTSANTSGPYGWFYWGMLRPVPGKLGESKLQSTVAGEKLTVVCTGGKSTVGVLQGLEPEGKGGEVLSKENVISFEGCKVSGSLGERCEVKSMTTNKLKGKLLIEKRLEEKFEPEEGTTVMEITLKSVSGKTCTLAGKFKLTGYQTCEFDKSNAEADEAKEEHTLYCKPSGSHLELAGGKAELESSLTSGVETEGEESKTLEKVDYAIEV